MPIQSLRLRQEFLHSPAFLCSKLQRQAEKISIFIGIYAQHRNTVLRVLPLASQSKMYPTLAVILSAAKDLRLEPARKSGIARTKSQL